MNLIIQVRISLGDQKKKLKVNTFKQGYTVLY